jgi:3-phosphoshikimate 1-carboxyvinyltransferase
VIATIFPSTLQGEVTAPASKSAMQRACALALLNKGTTIIANPGISNDDRAALELIEKCGASVSRVDESLRIESSGIVQPQAVMHCGESGLSVRMFTPILALAHQTTTITGEGSLLARPMTVFENVMPHLGVSISTNKGFLPMQIEGPLQPADCTMDGSQSSQYVTGILFALAKSAKKRVSLSVSKLASRPYVDLSLEMLHHFGYEVTNKDYQSFLISPAEEKVRDIHYTTEGDWSGAAFLLVGAAIAGNGVLVKGLDSSSSQADRTICKVLRDCGVVLVEDDRGVFIEKQEYLKAFEVDATHCPDLFPPLVALAAFCKGRSVLHGTSRLISKESNRLAALTEVFSRMGVTIAAEGDSMLVHGGDVVTGTDVDGHHDHRIVMACAVAALRGNGKMIIQGAEAIHKSYPDFFTHLRKLGAGVSLS